MGRRALCALSLVVLLCGSVQADELLWTPIRVLQRVSQGQPDIEAAKHRREGAASFLKGSGKQPNPEIKLSLSSGAVQEDANALTQRFEISGQPALRKGIAKSLYTQADRETLLVSRRVALDSLAAYYQVWIARRTVEIASVNHQLTLQLEDIARRRFAVGEVSQDEYRHSRLQSLDAHTELQKVVAVALATESNFRTLLALSEDESLTLPGGIRPPILGEMSLPDREELSSRIARLPEIEVAEARAQQAKLEATLASKAGSPDLYLYAYRADYSRVAATGVQFGISFPLFDWGELKAEQSRRESVASSLVAQAEASRRALKAELLKAWELCRGQTQYVQLLEQQLPDRKVLAEHSLLAYELGLVTLMETINIQKNYQSSLLELAREAVSLETQRVHLHLILKETHL